MLVSRKRVLASAVFATLISAAAALATMKPNTSGLAIESIEVTAMPFASFTKEPSETKKFGKLEWKGGLVLTSPSSSFGGWSGLVLDPDGKKLLALSDAGTWMTADVAFGKDQIAGLRNARIGPLKDTNGKPLGKAYDRDSEGVALADGNLTKGELLVSFERNSRIGRFAIDKGELSPPSSFLEIPPKAKDMGNDGFEAVTVLRGGPLKGWILAFAESPLRGESDHTGWLWTSVGKQPKPFKLPGAGKYGVTDAVSLSDGSVLILERSYSPFDGVRMRLRKFDSADLATGGEIASEVLIEADPSQEIDNMEGLAVREEPSGGLTIFMISDDNFNHMAQRTLLLEFALPAPAAHAADTHPVSAPSPQ